jgi:hypothetical protein
MNCILLHLPPHHYCNGTQVLRDGDASACMMECALRELFLPLTVILVAHETVCGMEL